MLCLLINKVSDLPGLGSCIPNPSREWGLKTPSPPKRVGRGGIAGKCCKQKVTVHFQRFLNGRGGLGEQAGSAEGKQCFAESFTHGGVLGHPAKKPHICTAPKTPPGAFSPWRGSLRLYKNQCLEKASCLPHHLTQ